MSTDERVADFPQIAFLKLLQGAQRLFATEQDRRNLLAGLGLTSAVTERQTRVAVMPGTVSSKADISMVAPAVAGAPVDEAAPLSSPASFAAELVDLVSRPSGLEAAVTLARRALAEIGADAVPTWDGLLKQLIALQRKARIASGETPDVAGYSGWLGFDCRHPYSLTDRFIGREALVDELDAWVADDAGARVRCIWALGGGGKSALAWHWLNRSLALLRRLHYEGAFWCSFYEKSFGFEEFLRRALVFCGQLAEADVRRMPREVVEDRLLAALEKRRVVVVLDGLERLMNGYAIVADRAVDLDALKGTVTSSAVTRTDRRMADPRDGAFIRRLARAQAARLLITSRLLPADLESGETPAPLPNVVFTELAGLREDDAIALWSSLLPQGRISKALRTVFRDCGYHPLVISVLARSVARRKGGWDEWLALEAHRDFNPREQPSEAAARTHIVETCLRDLDEPSYQLLGYLTATGKPMQRKELADLLFLSSRMSGDGRWVREEQVADHLRTLIELGLVGEARPAGQAAEYDVHPVVRGAAWDLLTDPTRKRVSGHILTEFWATPDRQSPSALDDLDKATGYYKLLVQTGQLDRAWEMFVKWFWPAYYSRGAYRQLLSLFGLLLPGREVMQLLPLGSRRAQGEATYILGDLLAGAGEGEQAKTLLRWCGTLRLQIGDLSGFLDAAHVRAWQTMYEGKLYETEKTLRELKLQALAFGAHELQPFLECWIGIVLALRGDKAGATRCFEHARGQTMSNNWWVQGLAEGLVYLDDASEALDVLGLLQKGADDNPTQTAWEKLTEGMAYVGTGNHERAKLALSAAYSSARKSNYKIVQCFALPYLAEIALKADGVDDALEWLDTYREIDPDDEYALSAADAWRVRARCALQRGDTQSALSCAQRAFRLAACDGPPFVYKAGLKRALDTLQDADGYVPSADATLDPQWEEALAAIADHERQLEGRIALLSAADADGVAAAADEHDRFDADAILGKMSPRDLDWWDDVTGSHPEVQHALLEHMSANGITPRVFREAFERSPHKSLLVVFHRLRAEKVIEPKPPRPVRELDAAEVERWLADTDAQQRSFDAFLESEFAARVRRPFLVHAFKSTDVAAFLKDYKRRIEHDAEPVAETWWQNLERTRAPLDMLVLAECVLTMPARLAEVVREISVDSEHGIVYAFYALLTRRASEQYESRAVSKSEGWSDVEVLLRLQDVKQQIGWPDASADVKQFWEKLERDNRHHLRQVLQLVEELRRRDASVADYHETHLSTNTTNIQANLAYLDYARNRNAPWSAAAAWPSDAAGDRWSYEGVTPSFTNAGKLEPDQLAGRLEGLLQRAGRMQLNRTEDHWWKSVESATSPQVRLRLAEELDFRRATIGQLYKAHVDSGTENPVAAIAYLDYEALRLGDDQKAAERAAEHNRVGNAHYLATRYLDAAACYESAIRERPAVVYFTNLAGALELAQEIGPSEALARANDALRRGLAVFPANEDLVSALAVVERKQRILDLGGFVPHAASHAMLPVVTPIAIEFDRSLAPLFEAPDKGALSPIDELTASMRKRIKDEMGIGVPGLRSRSSDDFAPGTYVVMLDEVPLLSGNVSLEKGLSLVAEATLSDLGVDFEPGTHPVDGSPARWVALADAARLPRAPWTPAEIVVQVLEAVIRTNLALFAGMQEVTYELEQTWSAAARQVATDRTSVERFTRMALALVEERVPMTDLDRTSEVFVAAASQGMDELVGRVRALPEIRAKLPGNGEGDRLFDFPSDVEQKLLDGLVPVGDEFVLALTPEYTQSVLSAVRSTVQPQGQSPAAQAIVVREPRLRRYVRKLVELEFPHLFVLSKAEVLFEDRLISRTPIILE